MPNNSNSRTVLLWLFIAAYLIKTVMSPVLGSALQKVSPLITIVILMGFTVVHGLGRYGLKQLLIFFLITFGISWGYESISIQTGFPFGHYTYTGHLGPKLGEVPLLIMPAYFAVGYLAWTLAHVLLDRFDDRISGSDAVLIPVFAAFVMVMWDLCMDPVSSTMRGAWIWRDGGGYFGVPFSNFLGWYLCTYTIFQAFALYRRGQGPGLAAAKLEEPAAWSLPAYMYGALALNSILPAFFVQSVQIESRDQHVWWSGDIHASMALIALFAMLFVSLLATVKARRAVMKLRATGRRRLREAQLDAREVREQA